MKILSLVNPKKFENAIYGISYKISNFPDGQKSITILNSDSVRDSPDDVRIESRLNSFEDLGLIICANQAIKEINRDIKVHLYIPYFLGARSDRKFTKGTSHYIKTVIAPIINNEKFTSVTVLDPHSDVVEACIKRFKKISNASLVKFALSEISPKIDKNPFLPQFVSSSIIITACDAGGEKKIYDLVSEIDYTGELAFGTKHRKVPTGEILSTSVKLPNEYKNKKFVLIDDICDGGRTFIELAKAIRAEANDPNIEIHLIVTHGIFSAGYEELSKHFKTIYCTNSVKDVPASLAVEDFTNNIGMKPIFTHVKQLNIF